MLYIYRALNQSNCENTLHKMNFSLTLLFECTMTTGKLIKEIVAISKDAPLLTRPAHLKSNHMQH